MAPRPAGSTRPPGQSPPSPGQGPRPPSGHARRSRMIRAGQPESASTAPPRPAPDPIAGGAGPRKRRDASRASITPTRSYLDRIDIAPLRAAPGGVYVPRPALTIPSWPAVLTKHTVLAERPGGAASGARLIGVSPRRGLAAARRPCSVRTAWRGALRNHHGSVARGSEPRPRDERPTERTRAPWGCAVTGPGRPAPPTVGS
jgi:hypothetical protein